MKKRSCRGNTMKNKHLSRLILVTFIITSLAGCGQSNQTTVTDPQTHEESSGEETGKAETEHQDAGETSENAASAPQASENAASAPQASENAVAADTSVLLGGHPWIDSMIPENITDDLTFSPKEDFYLYVNHERVKKSAENITEPSAQEKIKEKAMDYLTDDHADNHEMELVQEFYRAFVDFDSRDALGMEPLRPVIEDIWSIDSLDELSAFISDNERSGAVPQALNIMMTTDFEHSDDYVTALAFASYKDLLLEDPDEYAEPSDKALAVGTFAKQEVCYALTSLGFSENDAVKVYDHFHELEGILSKKLPSMNDIISGAVDPEYTYADPDEVKEWMKDYPIGEFLASRGFGGAQEFLSDNADYVKYLGENYTEENLELFKSYYIARYILANDFTCDKNAYRLMSSRLDGEEVTEEELQESLEMNAYMFLRRDLVHAMGKAYMTRYDAAVYKDQVITMFEELKNVYKEMIEDASWLSDEGRERAVEKVGAMDFYALYPNAWPDYSGLDFEGKSLCEMEAEILRFNTSRDSSLVGKPVDREAEAWRNWDALEDNAKCIRDQNAIMFSYAFLEQYDIDNGLSTEKLYAGIGAVLAHEMSHGFDELGAEFDAEGKRNSIFSQEDIEAFNGRVKKLEGFYDGIEVFKDTHVNGPTVSVEATADLTGFQAVMYLAQKEPEFDYDAFFTEYARNWYYSSSYENDLHSLKNDSHPLDYLRVNVVVQQFDEFRDTYDVREGDGMFLASEDRIFVW